MSLLMGLFIALGGDPIWVYVENEPQTRSQHVRDALETPTSDLYARCPNPVTRAYLDDLEWSRCALLSECDVKIRTRDGANVRSDIDLPAYSFSPREDPVPLNPQCYLHLQAVPEHLLYLSRISAAGKERRSTSKVFMSMLLGFRAHWWTKDYERSITQSTWMGLPAELETVITRSRLTYEPYPPLSQPYPYITRKTYKWHDGDISGEAVVVENYRMDESFFEAIQLEADMGTGIICTPEIPDTEH